MVSLPKSRDICLIAHPQHVDTCDTSTTCAAELPGICNVNLVSDTMGDGISPSAWSRGVSKPEKPTQGAPARAECPVPAAKSAPSGVHSAQNAQVSQWRTRPIGWPSRRRNRLLCICTLHIHIAPISTRPPPAGTRARARRRQGGFPPRDPDAPPHAGRHGHMRAGARLRGRPGAPGAAPGAAPGTRSAAGNSQEFGLASSHFPNWDLAISGFWVGVDKRPTPASRNSVGFQDFKTGFWAKADGLIGGE